ncbi:hypothetical protein ACR6HW_09565 [Fusibacter sp. JL298sf-3]
MSLYIKELKTIGKSLTYWVFVVVLALSIFTQLDGESVLTAPVEGSGSYGELPSDAEADIIRNGIERLFIESYYNSFSTYPLGVYKEVTLPEEALSEMHAYIESVTGMPYAEIKALHAENASTQRPFALSFEAQTTLPLYFAQMNAFDTALGGGSYYSTDALKIFSTRPRTYEEAYKDYSDTLEHDRVTGSYARLFSDYMGIFLAIFPVFIVVTVALRDGRHKAQSVVFSRASSSVKIIFSRYFAIVTLCYLATLVLSIIPTVESVYQAQILEVQPDYLAFFKYCTGWLLPTILFVVAFGYCLTMLLGAIPAILGQLLLYYIALNASGGVLVGYVGRSLIPRFNALGQYAVFEGMYSQLVVNRLLYTALALAFLLLTVAAYEIKRKGVLGHVALFKHRKQSL